MEILEKYESFHDWYLLGIAADPDTNLVELHLMFDNKKDHARVIFKGASRCLVTDFLIQNIIYSMNILTDSDTKEYRSALEALNNSYPWGRDNPLRKIAVITPSIGAELFVEFESLEIQAM
ncbi:hypothetical protein V4C53_45225 [Paraburkholderia azotifigens]|uniref:hypothetical protein n=1 Tax=Paraburkholderia azotifigens TaxID=2057004 RepID=UPI00317F314B